jgi:hypothetical protein
MEIITRAAAREAGLKTYFTGPCKKGHTGGRYVSDGDCMVCHAKRQRARWQNDPDYRSRKAERQQTPEYRTRKAKYQRRRRQNDPNYQLTDNLSQRVRKALKGVCKSAATMDLLGCTIEQLREHLEVLFKPGMTWENYGTVWHVDHCRPCASFDLTDPEQQRECFNFMNLQPLFGAENISKHAKPETETDFVGRMSQLFKAA